MSNNKPIINKRGTLSYDDKLRMSENILMAINSQRKTENSEKQLMSSDKLNMEKNSEKNSSRTSTNVDLLNCISF